METYVRVVFFGRAHFWNHPIPLSQLGLKYHLLFCIRLYFAAAGAVSALKPEKNKTNCSLWLSLGVIIIHSRNCFSETSKDISVSYWCWTRHPSRWQSPDIIGQHLLWLFIGYSLKCIWLLWICMKFHRAVFRYSEQGIYTLRPRTSFRDFWSYFCGLCKQKNQHLLLQRCNATFSSCFCALFAALQYVTKQGLHRFDANYKRVQGGLRDRSSLPQKLFAFYKTCSLQTTLNEFEQNFGLRAPVRSKLCWPPWRKSWIRLAKQTHRRVCRMHTN